MPYFVGTDEAGYGPNLGPLVVSVSVWQVDCWEDRDLFARLAAAVCPAGESDVAGQRVAIGDSKALYKPGKGLGRLEQGVLAMLRTLGKSPPNWRAIWAALSADTAGSMDHLPWYQEYDRPLPLALDAEALESQAAMLRTVCDRECCKPTHVESRAIFPQAFNQLIARHGNKAHALAHVTMDLVKSALATVPSEESALVWCDKLGGRNRYGPLLNHWFPDTLARVREESREASSYELGTADRRVEVQFRARGESFLPSALASMVSKYLRELAMTAFNQFWTSRVADLQPTAGYPTDARRFKTQIAQTQADLGIADDALWRCR